MELGIKGHLTRGDEVIKILETLGGVNRYNVTGRLNKYFYYIAEDKYKGISNSYIGPDEIKGYEIFSLEDFLEKFPYKVGDKVTLDNKLCSVIWMRWECNNIYYQVQGTDIMFTKKVIANELKPYKGKNTNMNIEYDLAKYSYEVKDGKLVIGEKKPKYPKNYEECCGVLSMCYATHYNLRYFTYEHGYNEYATTDKLCSLQDKLNILSKLIICRNAYWKIAGEYLELDKPWEPVWDESEDLYTIHTFNGEIKLSGTAHRNAILVFPIEEMREAFYENFKDLIEFCKELL